MRSTPVPHRCTWHSNTYTNAHRSADGSSSSCARCSTRRPAGATVHDDARGVGVCYGASAGPCRVGGCRPPRSACAEGERWRHIRRRMPVGEEDARGGGWRGEAACGPLRAPAPPPPRKAQASHTLPPIVLASSCTHGLCGGRLCGAAQRYQKRFWTATAPLTSSSSIAPVWPLHAA
jgi:hypothetical protein